MGRVLDIFPSKEVAKTVIDTGRVYIARGIGEGYVVSEQEVGIFDNIEEVNNGNSYTEQTRQEC